jgi:hypothetical protein
MSIAYQYYPVKRALAHPRLAKLRRAAEYFVVFEIVCQLALLVPVFGAKRGLFRAAAFGVSLLMLAVTLMRGRRHPASRGAILVLVIVALSILNPMRNSWPSAVAQFFLYLAILAPLFWVPGLKLDAASWYRALFLLWMFQSLSALVGILQVYFPGTFQPDLSSAYAGRSWDYIKSLMITTNTGQRVFRPMGLTGVPGAAAVAGMYAVLLGLLFFVRDKRYWFRIAAALSMAVGLAVIALSQVRTMLLMTGISAAAFLLLLQLRNLRQAGRRNRFGQRIARANVALAAGAIAATILLGSTLALGLAHKSVSERIETLFSQDPTQVYYSNRGHFLDHTVNDLLPAFPFGAGPGRWGMMYEYFGDPSNLDNPPIWAEIQWTGWLLDGGVPLILAYLIALAMTFQYALKTTLAKTPTELGAFAAFIFAYNLGALAQTFDNPFFIGQGGMEFWFMNALLYATVLGWSRCGGGRAIT